MDKYQIAFRDGFYDATNKLPYHKNYDVWDMKTQMSYEAGRLQGAYSNKIDNISENYMDI